MMYFKLIKSIYKINRGTSRMRTTDLQSFDHCTAVTVLGTGTGIVSKTKLLPQETYSLENREVGYPKDWYHGSIKRSPWPKLMGQERF